MTALKALGAGILAFVASDVGTYYATKDMAADGQRNRKIAGGLIAALGIYLAVQKNKPVLGIAIAAGGLLSGFCNAIMLQVLRRLPAKGAPQALSAVAYDNLGAVAYDNMGEVVNNNLAGWTSEQSGGRSLSGWQSEQQMSGWEQMGDPAPGAPWDSPNPF